jgi:very-short-patch-repair endonuclease
MLAPHHPSPEGRVSGCAKRKLTGGEMLADISAVAPPVAKQASRHPPPAGRDWLALDALMASPPVKRARAMRKKMTPPEVTLWCQLRALKTKGWHFRRQAPEGSYFLDFVCRQSRLVVEVDGIQHSEVEQEEHDKARDAYLKERGFCVLRFWAADIEHELDGVMSAIRAALGDDGSLGAARPPKRVGGRYGQLTRMGMRQRRRPSPES